MYYDIYNEQFSLYVTFEYQSDKIMPQVWKQDTSMSFFVVAFAL